MKINIKDIVDKAFFIAEKRLITIIKKRVLSNFLEAKRELINNVINHAVTKELSGQETAGNLSGTTGGVGNLFSFIGFESGSNPANDLILFLEDNIKIILPTKISVKNGTSVTIKIPTKKDFQKNLALPWESGRSWPHAIEEGIGNLGYFLAFYGKGRSKGGFQAKKEINNINFRPTDYISPMLTEFQKKVKLIK